MDVSSNEDVDEEIRDPEDVDKRLKIMEETSPLLMFCKSWIKSYSSLTNLITRNFASRL